MEKLSPELLYLIASYLPILDYSRLVRVNGELRSLLSQSYAWKTWALKQTNTELSAVLFKTILNRKYIPMEGIWSSSDLSLSCRNVHQLRIVEVFPLQLALHLDDKQAIEILSKKSGQFRYSRAAYRMYLRMDITKLVTIFQLRRYPVIFSETCRKGIIDVINEFIDLDRRQQIQLIRSVESLPISR